MGKYTEIKGSGGKFISVVVSKTGFDGLNQVSGTDTDPSAEQESCEVGLGKVKEIYWVNWVMKMNVTFLQFYLKPTLSLYSWQA